MKVNKMEDEFQKDHNSANISQFFVTNIRAQLITEY